MNNTVNASPLGLFGFGLTTILLNLHNIGLFAMSPAILAMGLAFGGTAQIIAGKFEMQRGNSFGGIVFNSYGAFWWTLVLILLLPKLGLSEEVTPVAMGYYLMLWGVLTFIFFLQTFAGHTIGKLVFASLTILFFLLSAADFTGSTTLKTVAGLVGFLCGSLATYEGAAIMINDRYGKNIFPL